MFSTLSRKVALETRDSARSHGLALPIQISRLIRRSYTFREIAALKCYESFWKRPREGRGESRRSRGTKKKKKEEKKKKWKNSAF